MNIGFEKMKLSEIAKLLEDNKIYHYSICSFKGMNLREARKEYIKMRNKLATLEYTQCFRQTTQLSLI